MDQFTRLASTILESTSKAFHEFLEIRKEGAKKIQHAAEKKGGPSKLTATHFRAKAKPYAEALRYSEDPKRSDIFAKHASECLSKLRSWKSMTQMEFQKVMGELEVWGEVYLKSKD